MSDEQDAWYAVRTVVEFGAEPATYEERITLWRTTSFEDAIALGEAESVEYATVLDGRPLDLVQAFVLADRPAHGAEVFSLMRDSTLASSDYLDRFFDTGYERQRQTE